MNTGLLITVKSIAHPLIAQQPSEIIPITYLMVIVVRKVHIGILNNKCVRFYLILIVKKVKMESIVINARMELPRLYKELSNSTTSHIDARES